MNDPTGAKGTADIRLEKRGCDSVRVTSRRRFLKTAVTGVVASSCLPTLLGAEKKSQGRPVVVGRGEYRYEALHNWGEVPDHIQWGDTHGVAVDEAGFIYVKHRSQGDEPMDGIVVFDETGKFVRSFGKEYHRGGHGIDIRKEGGQEFLYLCDIHNRLVVKTDLAGEHVWELSYPEEPGLYESSKRFRPTNVAFSPDGGFYVGDGYGSSYIHQYDKDARWMRTFGEAGNGIGQLRTPHGLWLDDRPGRKPSLVVADRANARLQYFTLDGKPLGFYEDMSFPAHFDIQGDLLLVPDLHARVTLLGKDNELIDHLGYDPAWTEKVKTTKRFRDDPSRYEDGRFVHPHDACFDRQGNILVVEWVPKGRVTLLRKLS